MEQGKVSGNEGYGTWGVLRRNNEAAATGAPEYGAYLPLVRVVDAEVASLRADKGESVRLRVLDGALLRVGSLLESISRQPDHGPAGTDRSFDQSAAREGLIKITRLDGRFASGYVLCGSVCASTQMSIAGAA